MDYTLVLLEISDKLSQLIVIGYGILGVMILQYVKGAIKGWRI